MFMCAERDYATQSDVYATVFRGQMGLSLVQKNTINQTPGWVSKIGLWHTIKIDVQCFD